MKQIIGVKKSYLSGLNSQQYAAATTIDGVVLIFAGAGAGKTKTLISRLAFMVDSGVNPKNILCITFTRMAAEEMRSRAAKMLGIPEKRLPVTIGTFHSLGLRILRENGFKNHIVIDDTEQVKLVKKVYKDIYGDDFKEKVRWGDLPAPADLVAFIEHYKITARYLELGRIDVDDAANALNISFVDAGEILGKYEEYCKQGKILDFSDLITLPIFLFKRDRNILAKYQKKWQYIMVDEYQDTNYPQFELTKLLAGDNLNLCVVGDDDQAIYGWRGADYRIIQRFKNEFEDVKVFILDRTYRCPQEITTVANYIIKKNKNRVDKSLRPAVSHRGYLHFKEFFSDKEEANFIADEILRLRKQGYSYEDMAVFYRINSYSYEIERALVMRGIPYVVRGAKFFERAEIKDCLAFLRVVYNEKDFLAFGRLLELMPGVGNKSVLKIQDFLTEKDLGIGEFLKKSDEYCKTLCIQKKQQGVIKSFAKLYASACEKVTPTHGLDIFLGFYRELLPHIYKKDGGERISERISNVMLLANLAKQFGSYEDFFEHVLLFEQQPEKKEGVNLMTVHASKGLEFKVVFIAGLIEGIFPMDFNPDITEERRLMYVAVTRAKERLYFLTAQYLFNNRLSWMRSNSLYPSRYFNEALEGGINDSRNNISQAV